MDAEERYKEDIIDSLQTVTINIDGISDETAYSLQDDALRKKIVKLKKLKKSILSEIRIFSDKKEDYQAYRQYEACFDRNVSEFNAFKRQVPKYLSSYTKKKDNDICQEAIKKIQRIELTHPKEQFQYGFRNLSVEKRNFIETKAEHAKNEINKILENLIDTIKGMG